MSVSKPVISAQDSRVVDFVAKYRVAVAKNPDIYCYRNGVTFNIALPKSLQEYSEVASGGKGIQRGRKDFRAMGCETAQESLAKIMATPESFAAFLNAPRAVPAGSPRSPRVKAKVSAQDVLSAIAARPVVTPSGELQPE